MIEQNHECYVSLEVAKYRRMFGFLKSGSITIIKFCITKINKIWDYSDDIH